MKINRMTAAMTASALLCAPAVFASSKKLLSSQDVKSVPGELIVKLKKGESIESLTSNKSLGITLKEEIKLSYGALYLVKTDNKSINVAAAALNARSEVEYAEPNFIYEIDLHEKHNVYEQVMDTVVNTNDPRFGELWGLVNTGTNEPGNTRGDGVEGADVNALAAWERTTGDKNVKIAVIDTGIDYNHPDLAANMWVNEAEANGEEGVDDDGNGFVDDIHGYDFANNDGDPIDGHSHGTHCAGTIGAVHNNGQGVAGVMNDVTFVAVKFLSDGGSGSTANAVRAIDYATSLNVDLMSNSWGGGGFSQALKDAIQNASDAGIVFTAAAGNSSTDNDVRPHYPSNYDVPNVVSVAAHTAQDQLASFSCYGRTTVHIAAPGHRILSSVKDGGYAVYSGTSMATPHVSGALGLLIAQEGRLDHAEMRERLMATSEPIRAYRRKTISGGRLNAENLLANRRPARNEPPRDAWQRVELDEVFESAHPYADNARLSKTVTVEGARFIRVLVKQYDIESGYDFLTVRNAARAEIEKVSGAGADFVTDYVEGDTVHMEFTSDSSVTKWGFRVEAVEAIYE